MLGSLLVARLLCGDVTSSWYGKNLSLAWKKPLVWKEHGTVFQPLRSRYSGTWWMSGVSWFTENRRKSISGQGIVCNRALRARLGQVSVTSLQSHRKKKSQIVQRMIQYVHFVCPPKSVDCEWKNRLFIFLKKVNYSTNQQSAEQICFCLKSMLSRQRHVCMMAYIN